MIVILHVAFVGCRIEREADVDVGYSWDVFRRYVADDHVVLFIYLVGAFGCHAEDVDRWIREGGVDL